MNGAYKPQLNKHCVYAFVTLQVMLLILGIVESKKHKNLKKAPEAFWSKWSEWDTDCSKTCGIGVRRRTRACIVPVSTTPKAKIIKAMVKKIVKINLNKRCPGTQASQARNCDTGLTCPIHGGWSAWESWECTVTCGGGTGVKHRVCNNPAPAFNGMPCNGSSQEAGQCNTHLCPDQIYTLSPNTAKDLKSLSQNKAQNFNKSVGSKLRIACGPNVVGKIYNEYPKTQLYWTKNGVLLYVDEIRIKMTPTELVFEALQLEDNGIYVCRVIYAPNVDKPISVAALVVLNPKPDQIVYSKEKLALPCLGDHLATIYKNLTQKWLKDGRVIKDFENKSPLQLTRYVIVSATSNLSGLWSCEITDQITKRVWIANAIFLKVLPSRKFHEKIMSDKMAMLSIFVTVFLVFAMIGIYFSYQITEIKDSSMAEFENWCKIVTLEKEKSQDGIPDWAQEEKKPEEENETEESAPVEEEGDKDDED